MNEPSFKVWHCNYNWQGSYGAYQEYDCVVVAEIKDKALGMALMAYPDTHAQDWTATEIPLEEDVHHITGRSS
jgi:hypothetical protein